jgi:hypothetical protein
MARGPSFIEGDIDCIAKIQKANYLQKNRLFFVSVRGFKFYGLFLKNCEPRRNSAITYFIASFKTARAAAASG